eukprot:PhM_4_TR11629/c4_g1_i1/m.57244
MQPQQQQQSPFGYYFQVQQPMQMQPQQVYVAQQQQQHQQQQTPTSVSNGPYYVQQLPLTMEQLQFQQQQQQQPQLFSLVQHPPQYYGYAPTNANTSHTTNNTTGSYASPLLMPSSFVSFASVGHTSSGDVVGLVANNNNNNGANSASMSSVGPRPYDNDDCDLCVVHGRVRSREFLTSSTDHPGMMECKSSHRCRQR